MRFRLAMTAALSTLALASCSSNNVAGTATQAGDASTPGSQTSTKAGKDDMLTWVDKVCGVTVEAVAPMQQEPTLDQNNLTNLKNQFIDYLTKASQALDKGRTDLAALKDGPSKDSERYVTSASDSLGKLKGTMDTSIQKMQAANPKKPQEFALDVQAVGLDLQGASLVASTSVGLLVEKELADAEKVAPNCRKLQSS
jgi:hypothetical protein